MSIRPSWASARAAAAFAAAACGVAFASPSLATVTVTYSLTGAVFDAFPDEIGAETVSGTWTVDLTHNRVRALSLVATGGETLDFTLDGVEGMTYAGGEGVDQYEIQLRSTVDSLFYLDWQATAPITMLVDASNGYESNLYRTGSFAYSGLTSPGVLTATVGSTVPEPASWALMVGGFGLVGLTGRRRAPLAA